MEEDLFPIESKYLNGTYPDLKCIYRYMFGIIDILSNIIEKDNQIFEDDILEINQIIDINVLKAKVVVFETIYKDQNYKKYDFKDEEYITLGILEIDKIIASLLHEVIPYLSKQYVVSLLLEYKGVFYNTCWDCYYNDNKGIFFNI